MMPLGLRVSAPRTACDGRRLTRYRLGRSGARGADRRRGARRPCASVLTCERRTLDIQETVIEEERARMVDEDWIKTQKNYTRD